MSGRQPPRVYDSNSPGWRTTCPVRIDNVACANARAKFKLTHYANDRLEAHQLALRERPDARMAENEEPEFRATVISDAELDRFIADLGAHPLALDELRPGAEDVY